MHTEEIIIKVLSKITMEYPNIDAIKLKGILEAELYEYDIEPKCKALTINSNIQDRIIMYLATKKLDGLSPLTIQSYKLHLVRFSNFMRKNVEDITTMDIRMYLAALVQEKKLKNTSLANEISILKSFFSWLEDEEYIAKSPVKKIKQTKVEKRLRKSLSVEELERLRDACKTSRERALLEFIFSTGCRLSEVTSVNISDINWNDYSLNVIGKGNKERTVYFSPKAKIYIEKYLRTRRGELNNPALFINSKKPFNRLGGRSVEREIGKIAQNAEFDKAVFPHLLRHTMATLALQSGATLTTVQTLLGHEDPATTEIYAEIGNETVKQEYRKHLIQ